MRDDTEVQGLDTEMKFVTVGIPEDKRKDFIEYCQIQGVSPSEALASYLDVLAADMSMGPEGEER